MKQNPTISVIVPTRNRGYTLERAIQSVLAQTYTDFELIIIDDGSTDNTAEVISRFHDDRIKFIQKNHRGGAAARNTGIQNAHGIFIAFQDSDDEWYPLKLEKQINFFQTAPQKIGVVYTGFWKMTKEGEKVYLPKSTVHVKEGNVYHQLLEENFITTQAAMVREDCFEKVGMFDETLPGLHEWDLWLRISREFDFGYIAEPLLQTYFTRDSITAKHQLRLRAQEIILNKYFNEFKKYPKILARHSFSVGNTFAIQGNFRLARPYLKQASLSCPKNLKYWAAWVLGLLGSKKIYRAMGRYGKYLNLNFLRNKKKVFDSK